MRYTRWIHEITVFGIISQTTNLFFVSVIEIIKGIMIAKMLSKLKYFSLFPFNSGLEHRNQSRNQQIQV
jgi:hypothetical protein